MNDRQIAAGVLRVGAYVLVAKLVIAGREIAIARTFGIGPVSDAYNVAITIGSWLPLLLAGAVGAVLVPALVVAQHDSRDGRRFIAELNAHALLAAALCAMVGLGLAWIAPLRFGTGVPAYDARLVGLLVLMIPFAALTSIFYYLANRLQALNGFAYTLAEAIPAACVILSLGWLGPAGDYWALGWATAAGSLIQVWVLARMLRRRGAGLGGLAWSRRAAEWQSVTSRIGIMVLGQLVLSLATPLDQFIAVKVGVGIPASIGYANRLIGLGTSIGTLVLGRTMLPAMAALNARDPQAALRLAWRWVGLTFALGLGALAMGSLVATPATSLAFERGAFTAADTAKVAHLLQLGLWQLPFYFSGVVAVQFLAAKGRYATISAIAVMTLGVKAGLMVLLVPGRGAAGLMLSTAGMYCAAALTQIVVMARSAVR